MPDNLFNALSEFDESVAQHVPTYSGLLGLPVSNRVVEVPDRNGYVYVRLRDNQSEIIQAYNEKVSPVYNLPVLVSRQGNRWVIVNRDIERYENWGSYSSFLPAHAHQHEFDRSDLGGDIVFSYIDQLQPLLVYPSGTPGSSNVLVGGYNFKKNDSTWAYVGNTGTPSVLIYKPTDNQARMVLVYLDRTTGNPGLLINSGTSFAANLTGTHDVLQYLPSLTSTQEPLKAIRLVSGSTYVGWDNLYDIRQFFGGSASGTGGGTTNPAGSDQHVQFNQSNSFGADYNWHYDYTNHVMILGSGTPPSYDAYEMHMMRDGASPGFLMWSWSNNSAVNPYIRANRAGGTRAVPTRVDQFFELFQLRAAGYNGVNWTNTQAEILMDAPYAWVSGSHPTEMSFWITPSGTATMQAVGEVKEYGWNLASGKNYRIAGSPHTHTFLFPFATYLDLNPITATGKYPYGGTIERSMTFIEWSQAIFSLGAHDSSNYYTLTLKLRQTSGDSTIASLDTKTLGAGTAGLKVLSTTSFSTGLVTGTGYIYMEVTKTLSPADLYILCPSFRVGYVA